MTIQTQVTDRKSLAKAIAEELGTTARYMGVPGCGYQIGDYVIDRDGNLIGEDFSPLQDFLLRNGYISSPPPHPRPVSDSEAQPDESSQIRRMDITVPAPEMTVGQTLTGVKGNAESSYRTGNVNLTAANIGAAASSHTHAASGITSGTLSRDRLPGELWIDMGTLSSLPTTKTFSGIRTDMICARLELGTPSAQRSDWEINTDTENSVTISGTISGTTTCKVLLVQAESGTAS